MGGRVVVARVLKPSEVKSSYSNWAEILYETGWWFDEGEIVVVEQENKADELKTLLHEILEFYLEKYFTVPHETAHQLALNLESFIELLLKSLQ